MSEQGSWVRDERGYPRRPALQAFLESEPGKALADEGLTLTITVRLEPSDVGARLIVECDDPDVSVDVRRLRVGGLTLGVTAHGDLDLGSLVAQKIGEWCGSRAAQGGNGRARHVPSSSVDYATRLVEDLTMSDLEGIVRKIVLQTLEERREERRATRGLRGDTRANGHRGGAPSTRPQDEEGAVLNIVETRGRGRPRRDAVILTQSRRALLETAASRTISIDEWSKRCVVSVERAQKEIEAFERQGHLSRVPGRGRARWVAATNIPTSYGGDEPAETRDTAGKYPLLPAEQAAVSLAAHARGSELTSIAGLVLPRQDALALGAPVQLEALPGETVNVKDGSVLVLVPGGTYIVGADDCGDDAEPPHLVTLPEFYIGECQVTNGQFRRFVSHTGYEAGADWLEYAVEWGEQAPVVCVTWDDAVAYCSWAGLRLPTEEEWEAAARGPDARRYPWGNDWDPSLCVNSVGAAIVGSCPGGACPCGALDMAGNVWEWTSSWYNRYPGNGESNESYGQRDRVLRGGSWGSDEVVNFRGAYRCSYDPGSRDIDVGFRVARTL